MILAPGVGVAAAVTGEHRPVGTTTLSRNRRSVLPEKTEILVTGIQPKMTMVCL